MISITNLKQLTHKKEPKSWVEREAYRLKKSEALLSPAVEGAGGIWADLGCGEGIYTYLLSNLLQPDSQIYAVDRNHRALHVLVRNLAESRGEANIQTLQADFTRPLTLPPLDGLLMVNSLHFVKKKKLILARLVNLLKPGGKLVVVEYNTRRENYAVPYPLDETDFLELATRIGLRNPRILVKMPSTFLGEQYTGIGLAQKVIYLA